MDVVSLCSEFPNDNPALHRGTVWICHEPTGSPESEPNLLALREGTSPGLSSSSPKPEMAHGDVGQTPLDVDLLLDNDEADVSSILVEELEPLEATVEGEREPAEPSAVEGGPPLSVGVDALLAMTPEPATAKTTDAVVEETSVVEALSSDAIRPAFDELPESAIVTHDSSGLPPAPDDPFTVLVCTLADVAIQAGSPNVASLLPGLLFDGRLPDSLDPDVIEALRASGLWDGRGISDAFVTTTGAWRAILRGTSDDFDACGAAMLDEWASDLLAKLLSSPARAPTLRQELRSRGVAAFGLAA